MCCIMLLVGVDDEKGAQCFKVDPAGHYLPYKAVATGKAEPDGKSKSKSKSISLNKGSISLYCWCLTSCGVVH